MPNLLRETILNNESNWTRYCDRGDRVTLADVTDPLEAAEALIESRGMRNVAVDARIFDAEERVEIAAALHAQGLVLVQVEGEHHCDRVAHFERYPVLLAERVR